MRDGPRRTAADAAIVTALVAKCGAVPPLSLHGRDVGQYMLEGARILGTAGGEQLRLITALARRIGDELPVWA